MIKIKSTIYFATCVLLSTLMPAKAAFATTVQFQTTLGNFEVVLFDNSVPITVTNFLEYVEEERYEMSIIHRLVPGFVLQGGGFQLVEEVLRPIALNDPIANESRYSNVRGTIAMATISGNPDSATSQWFINLVDNSEGLDFENGGFTVFGQVISGMAVVDALADINVLSFDLFPSLPLIDYTSQDAANEVDIQRENYVLLENVVIIDEDVDSDSVVTPVLIDQSASPTPTPEPSGSDKVEGIGSIDISTTLFLSLLLLSGIKKRLRIKHFQ